MGSILPYDKIKNCNQLGNREIYDEGDMLNIYLHVKSEIQRIAVLGIN